MSSTILVTGGAGYIGSVCVKRLLSSGHKVIVVDNLSKGRRELVDPKAVFYQYDTQDQSLSKVFSAHRIDAVIHFAAYKAVGEPMHDAVKYSSNISGLINVLNLMVAHDVKKMVFSSTAAVYGDPQYLPVDESHPTAPVSFYGATKLACEGLLGWYSRIHGVRFVALRYFNVVGDELGYLDPEPQNVLPLIMEAAFGKRKEFLVFGTDYETKDGTGVRDYIDIHDLVDAHLRALSLEKDAIINLGTSLGTSVKDLLALCDDVHGRPVPSRAVARRAGDPAVVVASNALAKELLGWSPQVPLKESVRATYEVYLSLEK